MALLTALDITKIYGLTTVLNRATLRLHEGERIGLVGINGVGKSTLLKIIAGELPMDGGSVTIAPNVRLGYLPQVITAGEDSTLGGMIAESLLELRALERQMRTLEAAMTTAQGEALAEVMAAYGDAADRFERAGGYDIDAQINTVLDGLRVGHLARERAFATLSGGEKSRVALALLLLRAPDVLLLDEPTNHLDYASLTWLEAYLADYRGAMLVVSHDRAFLERTVNVIVEIDEHTRTSKRYAGGYSAYLAAKQAERGRWEAEYLRQQEEIHQLRYEIKQGAHRNSNYRAQSDGDKMMRNKKIETHAHTVSRRLANAEERLKRIEADPIPKPPEPLTFAPAFDPQALRKRAPLFVSGLVKHYGAHNVLDGVTFTLDARSRIMLVGPNGAGKSTLLKILMRRETADAGEVWINPGAQIGYLAQEMPDDAPFVTVFDAFRSGLAGESEVLKAMLIKSGLFRWDEFDRPVRGLSSGQRRKLQIARLMAERANLLILDEPTHHVSFDVLEAFEDALREFPGPIIAASHDRRFIERFGGELWELRDGQIIRRAGGYEAYAAGQAVLTV